ncbi:UBTD1 protein, partial [Polypterus senegalus]
MGGCVGRERADTQGSTRSNARNPRKRGGSLTECYDELGNRYQLPVYCLAPPVNLISERSEEESSNTPEPQSGTKREFQLKVRLSTGKDLRLNASMSDTIGQLKKQLQVQEDIDPAHQRWFFSGKLLTDKTRLQETKIQKDFVIQVIVNKICAVLAAVTDVIRSQGGKETETEYFAALMTTLEVVDSGESMAAVAFLLNLVLKRVPSSVLIKKFSDTSKVFMNIMSSNASLESPLGLRLILSCLSTLLKKQDASVWSYASTLQVYHGLLSFTVHSKPKALYDYLPSENDLQPMLAWLTVMEKAHIHLSRQVEEGLTYRFHSSWCYVLHVLSVFYQVAGKKANAIMLKIWTLLPGFCLYPTDLTTSFKGIARVLGMALSERPDLRPVICQAIRTLIKKSCDKEESQAEVGRFAKNFLPILFNVYTKNPEDGDCPTTRMCVLDTIKVYLAVTEQQMICSFLQKASEKLSEAENTEFQRVRKDSPRISPRCSRHSSLGHAPAWRKCQLSSRQLSGCRPKSSP